MCFSATTVIEIISTLREVIVVTHKMGVDLPRVSAASASNTALSIFGWRISKENNLDCQQLYYFFFLYAELNEWLTRQGGTRHPDKMTTTSSPEPVIVATEICFLKIESLEQDWLQSSSEFKSQCLCSRRSLS